MSEYVYGRRPVLEALRAAGRPLHKLWIADGTHGTEEILKLARDRGVPVERVRHDQLDKRIQGGHHQGVVAQAGAAAYLDLDEYLAQLPPTVPAILIALDEIQDPHNIGAILRSAGFFGASAAIVPRWRSAPVGETAARVSSGAIEHIPLMRVRNLADAILTLKEANFEVIGADMEGSPLEEHKPSSRTALVFGSEGKGLRRLVGERCDKLLKISGAGPVESLNVGAAAAIFLHHFCRGIN
jgi:23S rRNA (guanosine2251-2'-O)-methyltransferase